MTHGLGLQLDTLTCVYKFSDLAREECRAVNGILCSAFQFSTCRAVGDCLTAPITKPCHWIKIHSMQNPPPGDEEKRPSTVGSKKRKKVKISKYHVQSQLVVTKIAISRHSKPSRSPCHGPLSAKHFYPIELHQPCRFALPPPPKPLFQHPTLQHHEILHPLFHPLHPPPVSNLHLPPNKPLAYYMRSPQNRSHKTVSSGQNFDGALWSRCA